MNSKVFETIHAVGVALTLGSWASPGLTTQIGADRFSGNRSEFDLEFKDGLVTESFALHPQAGS